MVYKTEQLVQLLESIAPLSLAESWDNPGYQVGPFHDNLDRVLFSLDPSYSVVDLAIKQGYSLVISHHPLIFKPIKRVDPSTAVGKIIVEASRAKVSIYSMHTNLDVATEGLNQVLAWELGLEDPRPIIPNPSDPNAGLGRYGQVATMGVEELMGLVKKVFGPYPFRYNVSRSKEIKVVAVISGSGGSIIKEAFEKGADVLIGGDFGHHHFLEAESLGLGLVDVTHHIGEEKAFKGFFQSFREKFQAQIGHTKLDFFERGNPPFVYW